MTAYADLLDTPNLESNHLVVIEPRRKVTGFTLFSGSVYRVAFDLDVYGEVRRVEQDGVALTFAVSSALSAGEFYHDLDAGFLYVRMSDSSNPSTKFVTAGFEIYLGTIDAHTYRVPTDDTTREVYFEPLIARSVTRKDSVKDLLFGFSPDQRSSLEIINGEARFERILFDTSFNLAPVKVWHWLGSDNDAESRRLILSGLCKDVTYSDSGGKVTIQVFDQRSKFSEEFRNEGAVSFMSASDFADLDPTLEGSALRRVYGVVDGARAYNVDFDDVAPSSSNNRIWVAATGDSNLGTVTQTVAGSPSSTTTRTYLSSANGLRVGDSFENGGTSESALITAVNRTSAPFYIDHSTVVTPASGGQTVTRSAVGVAHVIQDGTLYTALYGRDFALTTFGAQDAFGLTFVAGLAANIGLPSEISPRDTVYLRIYGQKNDVTLGGPAFGANDTESGNLAQGVVVLLDVLKRYAGIEEADIDAASFTALQASKAEAVGFSIPQTQAAGFPPLKDIVTDLTKSLLVKLFVNDERKWEVTAIEPFSAAVDTLETEDTGEGSFSYAFSWEDVISRVEVEYAHREVHKNPGVNTDQVELATADSDTARYLHKVARSRSFDVLLFKPLEADTLATRLAAALGERRGEVELRTAEKRFMDTRLGDTIELKRIRLPGSGYDGETVLSQLMTVEETEVTIDGVRITGSDQKGIEDAPSW